MKTSEPVTKIWYTVYEWSNGLWLSSLGDEEHFEYQLKRFLDRYGYPCRRLYATTYVPLSCLS